MASSAPITSTRQTKPSSSTGNFFQRNSRSKSLESGIQAGFLVAQLPVGFAGARLVHFRAGGVSPLIVQSTDRMPQPGGSRPPLRDLRNFIALSVFRRQNPTLRGSTSQGNRISS